MNLWSTIWTPMLLTNSEKMITDNNFLYEIKFDGIRALLFITSKQIVIKNRHGKDITKKFPELQEIKKIASQKMIIDGEITLFEKNRPNFSKLIERIHCNPEKTKYDSQTNPVIFIAFDILYKEKDITSMPLIKRKEVLNQLKDTNFFCKSKTFENGKELFIQTKKLKLEGIVAKEKNSIYEINTRSISWIKIKHQKQEIFYIGGYQEKPNNDVISLLLGEYQNKKLNYVGKVTVAKKNPIISKLKKLKTLSSNPFDKKITNFQFVVPKYTCLVKYLERTNSGSLRHPIFQKIIEKK